MAIDFVVREGIGVLTLENPPLNLNTLQTIHELSQTCAKIASDDQVHVVVIHGGGDRAFCAGSDIHEFPEVRDDVVTRKLAKENAAFTAIESLPQPVIAALDGTTLGGGAEIALACDLRFMDGAAKIGFPEINLGVFPGSGGIFRLPWLVGSANAFELLYTGDAISAARAQQIGLVSKVCESGQALEDALDLARRLCWKPQLALRMIKAGVRAARLQNVEQATARTLDDSAMVFASDDLDEGVAAFFAKREPRFPSSVHHK